ncbi:hypothetical protein [Rheinheimera faecalis]
MLKEYFPDGWTIVKFKDGEKLIYKIFATWRSGNESWRLSSGAKNLDAIIKNGTLFTWPQASGSVYYLSEERQNCNTAYQENVLDTIKAKCVKENVEFDTINLS